MVSRGLSSPGAITICRCIRGNRDGEGKREGGSGKKYRKANAFEFVYLYIFRVAPSETSNDVKPFLM